ncbi:protein translocase subunit SecDF [Mammaliicoccus sciuri]|uniref:Multifunctional fusion protein n=3 Tax=Mammaliicoccus sciuri TaxID=1296 RepID=A0AAI8DHN5_MAMSC|nr:protein translocase subunit SecDF [Mammaliicoccus sciuri]OOV37911.1 protein translocase subunit SecDF [Staphylococcus sp. MB371]PCQ21812.1 protein translocase subunit SecDF [Klebsiella pneumoniae]ASE33967.1 protein translocase subunit SecDF [Mammaliicoccus sciuri]KTT85527.1 preprotein translocase subunit SecD [Mammaliicoccus sciuri]KTT87715.1 preprotein translocase subunit SecD [Mammaliicoccus sciuri]
MKKRSRIIAFLLLAVLVFSLIGSTTKDITKNVNLGLDLQGGFEVLYQVNPLDKGDKIDNDAVKSTAKTLESRVNVLGVSEPKIQVEEGNRIRVQLAGIKDQNEAREVLSTQANLTIRDAKDRVLLSGKDLVQGGAKQGFKDNTNEVAVTLKLKDAKKFKEVTEKVSKMNPNLMVIWMDYEKGDSYAKEAKKEQEGKEPKYISAATVSQPINSENVEISGGFNGEKGVKEAKQIADLLNSGSLPVKLDEVYSTSVGAQFGKDALDETVLASSIGVGIIFLFMLIYYRLPGVVAVITLSAYVYLTLVAFNFISGVLTLPGLAALVLGVGMAVDANIIMYERIKDELRIGRTLQQSFKKGSGSSFITILDANLTTILAALVLFVFGESSVKGFATMLLLAILMSFVTSVFFTRILLALLVNSNYFKKKYNWFGVSKKDRHDISERLDVHDLRTVYDKINFVKLAKPLLTFSIITIIIGAIIISIFRLNLGIDFTSGTRVDLQSDQAIKTEQVSKQFKDMGLEPSQVTTSGTGNKMATVQFKDALNKSEIQKVKSDFGKSLGHDPNVSTVSPVVGQELAGNAFKAMLYAALGIVLYVSFRFEWRMGTTAVLALLHDVFMIVSVFSLFRLEVDITFIAAVLTIIGYSINDTIVTFDRVRENLRKVKVITKPETIDMIVNSSIRQTMTRSINTVLTVVIVVVALLILGSSSIFNFSLALLIGLVSGVFSSVFVAVPLWGILKKRQLKKSENGKLVVYTEKKSNDEKILV